MPLSPTDLKNLSKLQEISLDWEDNEPNEGDLQRAYQVVTELNQRDMLKSQDCVQYWKIIVTVRKYCESKKMSFTPPIPDESPCITLPKDDLGQMDDSDPLLFSEENFPQGSFFAQSSSIAANSNVVSEGPAVEAKKSVAVTVFKSSKS